jgi:hypothetical protein
VAAKILMKHAQREIAVADGRSTHLGSSQSFAVRSSRESTIDTAATL